MSCYCSNLICYNTIDGTSFPLKCRSYTCPEHGSYNRGRLRAAIQNWLEVWDMVRMWTFTLSSKYFKDAEEHLKNLSECWRYFITQLRRSPSLRMKERDLQYIRIMEPHRSGYFHFHVFVDRYVHWSKLYSLWITAVATVTGLPESVAGCHVKGIFDSKKAAWYCVKYVTKSAFLKPKFSKLYTKSVGVAFFPAGDKKGIWAVFNQITGEWF